MNALKAIVELREKIEREQADLQARVSMSAQMLRAAQEGIVSNEGALAALRTLEETLKPKRVDNPSSETPQ